MMLVKDMMSPAVSCRPEDSLSTALSLMLKNSVHAIPVLFSERDKYHAKDDIAGMLVLNNIITKEVDPSKTKVKDMVTSCPSLKPDDNMERAIDLIIGANLRVIPVWDKDTGLCGILSEIDVLRHVKLDGLVKNITKSCLYCAPEDNIGKVKKMITYDNISRVPIVDNGKFVGIIGAMDLIKILMHGWTPGEARAGKRPGGLSDRGYTQTINLDRTKIKDVMVEATVISKDNKINDAIDLLKKNDAVLVSDILGIITPKDILRQITTSKAEKTEIISIIGAEGEDSLTLDKIYQSAENLVKSLNRSNVEMQPMKIHIRKHKKQGPKTKYSVKVELPCSLGTFHCERTHGKNDKSYGDLRSLGQSAIKDLERMIREKQEEFKKPNRRMISKRRALIRGK